MAPEIENPVPVTAAVFTVSGAVPVEETVTACSWGVFRMTLPNPIDVAFTLIFAALAVDGEREMLNALDTPLSFAVMIAVCGVVTLATVAVIIALAGWLA